MATVRGWMRRSQRLLDHDPEIDRFKTLWREERLKEADFAMLAGLAVQTVHKMFDGQTKRPQGLTYHKMAKALGCKYVLTRDNDRPDYKSEIPKAREEFKEYQRVLAQRRLKKDGGKK